jgi:hypothetical protein
MKVVRDGCVAVLYSPGYGAGWYSWHGIPELLFDPLVVDLVERACAADSEKAAEELYEQVLRYCQVRYPEGYFGGYDTLTIEWVPEGMLFRIDEYDGAECVYTQDQYTWLEA